MKNKCLVAVLIAQMVCLPLLAHSDEPMAVVVQKGAPAPFTGLLLNAEAQAKMIAEKNEAKRTCDLETKYLTMRGKADCDLQVNAAKIDLDAQKKKYDAITSIKDEEIKRLNEIALKSSNSNTHWWIALGMAGGIIITVSSFLLVKQLNKVE